MHDFDDDLYRYRDWENLDDPTGNVPHMTFLGEPLQLGDTFLFDDIAATPDLRLSTPEDDDWRMADKLRRLQWSRSLEWWFPKRSQERHPFKRNGGHKPRDRFVRQTIRFAA